MSNIIEIDFRFLSHHDLNNEEIEAINKKFVENSPFTKDIIFVEDYTTLSNNLNFGRVNLRHVIGKIKNINYNTMTANVILFDVPPHKIYVELFKNVYLCGKYLKYNDNTIKLVSFVAYHK